MKANRLFQIISISTLSFAFAAVLCATPASAQMQAGDWEAGFGLGGTKLDSDLADTSGNGFRAEVRGGYFFTDAFELEAQVQRSDAYFDSTIDTATLNAVYNFNTAGRAVPYVLAGVGGAKLDDFDWDFLPGEDNDPDNGEGLAYQAAVGTRLFFRPNGTVAARFEVSSLWEDTLDETHRHTSYTAGLVWRIR